MRRKQPFNRDEWFLGLSKSVAYYELFWYNYELIGKCRKEGEKGGTTAVLFCGFVSM